jgi:hypothetical protein
MFTGGSTSASSAKHRPPRSPQLVSSKSSDPSHNHSKVGQAGAVPRPKWNPDLGGFLEKASQHTTLDFSWGFEQRIMEDSVAQGVPLYNSPVYRQEVSRSMSPWMSLILTNSAKPCMQSWGCGVLDSPSQCYRTSKPLKGS